MNTSKTKVRSSADLPAQTVKKKKRVIEDAPPQKKKLKARVLDLQYDEDEPPEKRKKKVRRPLDVRKALEAPRAVAKRELTLPTKVKKDNLPAIFVKPATKRISKLHPNKMKSILGDSAEDIHQLLEADNNESASALLQKRLLQSVLDVIPLAEHSIRKTKGQRGVYQFNSLITSIREIMIDIQATRDKGAIAETLIDKMLRPAFSDVAMEIMKEEEMLKTFLGPLVSETVLKQILAEKHESIKRLSNLMQRKFEEARDATIGFLKQ